ncbi:MAG TPA: hypothetical protein PLX89_04925, partial [Verrucomicrobiota bacterium]|nr:hypothetical protein [Verrucomicrobiota bacterium]
MSEPSPRITSSLSAEESEGGLFGVATRSLIWVVPIAVVALGAFLILARTRSAVSAALLSIAPAAILIGAVRFIQNSGPVGFLLDHVSQIINGGNSSPLPKREHFQPPLFSPFPNGYLSDGLIVFGGLNGWVARGFTIETPDFQNASFSERNRAQECWSAFLRVVPEKWRIQFRVCDDEAGFAPRLLEYAQHTSRCVDPAVRKLRNANFVNLSGALEKGQLRRRQQTLFIGFQLSPGADGSVSELEMAKREFGQCEQTLRQCLAPIGARVMPLPDQEAFRQWVDAFNPSIRLEPDSDPLAGIQHPISLLENAWRSELRGQGNQGFVLDGFHHLCFTIKRLPTETYFTILHSLAASPFSGVTVTAQIRRLSKEPILREAQSKVERIHHQLVAKPDQALAVTLAQLEAKIRRLTAEGVVPMEIEVIVGVRASSPEELRRRAAAVKAAIHRMNGAQPFEATLASSSRSLFAKSLPAWMWSSHHGCTLYVEDPTGANLLPLAASFSGHPGPVHSLFPGSDGGLVNVVSFLGEQEAETPQQLVVLGGTGMGKSQVVTKLLIETSGMI